MAYTRDIVDELFLFFLKAVPMEEGEEGDDVEGAVSQRVAETKIRQLVDTAFRSKTNIWTDTYRSRENSGAKW